MKRSKVYRVLVSTVLILLFMKSNNVFADRQREDVLENALLHQYSNQIIDHLHSRNYCAKVLDITELPTQQPVGFTSFRTVIGVVSKNRIGRWEYLRMT